MEKITDEQLREVLMLHSLYLKGDPAGRRADLQGANLQGANLQEADMRWADMRGANLLGADLHKANLLGADLHKANLLGADMRWADLSWADMRWANLQEANLQWANLLGADMRWANLQWANLQEANLQRATMPSNYWAFSQIGSEGRQTTYSFSEDKVWCGCFTGTLKEFEAACQNHESELHKNQYLIMIKTIKSLKKLYDNQ